MDIMPPENQLPPHHAPTGLKLWLAVFGVVLVIALGYLVWVQNSAPDTTDYSANKTINELATVEKGTFTKGTDGFTTYTNTNLGFSFKYPHDKFCADEEAFTTGVVGLLEEPGASPCQGQFPVSVHWFPTTTTSSSDFADSLTKVANYEFDMTTFDQSLITRKETTLGGEKAVLINIAAATDSTAESYLFALKKGQANGITIVGGGLDEPSYIDLVASFKFTK